MRFGVADYGMSVWDGGLFDLEDRLVGLKSIGLEGIERLTASSADEAICSASVFHKLGMCFTTVRGPTPELSTRWAAGLGKNYVWPAVSGKDLDTFCRQVNIQIRACAKWNVRVALHNHLGTPVETQPQLETFMERCPQARLILDTAHLAAAGGDPAYIVRKYAARLEVMHLKDWLMLDPKVGLDQWQKRGRFCELGAGNIGLDNVAVMRTVREAGFDGWVFIEQDTHLQDPLKDLAHSRQLLQNAGF